MSKSCSAATSHGQARLCSALLGSARLNSTELSREQALLGCYVMARLGSAQLGSARLGSAVDRLNWSFRRCHSSTVAGVAHMGMC